MRNLIEGILEIYPQITISNRYDNELDNDYPLITFHERISYPKSSFKMKRLEISKHTYVISIFSQDDDELALITQSLITLLLNENIHVSDTFDDEPLSTTTIKNSTIICSITYDYLNNKRI